MCPTKPTIRVGIVVRLTGIIVEGWGARYWLHANPRNRGRKDILLEGIGEVLSLAWARPPLYPNSQLRR
jgi:hypothetical protein